METKLLTEINSVLKEFPEYWDNDYLIKYKVIEDLRDYRVDLIESLMSKNTVFKSYVAKTTKGSIIKIDELISMLRYKSYWDDSYTKYSTQIGLTSDDKYLGYNSDVVLDFPYKDCVFEGGMTSEEHGKKEVYYHKVLAKEEIDILFSEKVLQNMKKFSEDAIEEVHRFEEHDNLILKGNNLIALHSLRNRYAEKVKLIYIDPPYNTGGDSFAYNDRFNHSTWLTFMKNRISVMKDLLADDGSIWINIDDNEMHYLKVLCDEIFGQENFVGSIIWKSSDNSNNDAKKFSLDHNYLLVYSKRSNWQPKKVQPGSEQTKHYKNPDNDPRGPWFDGNPISSPNPRPNLCYEIVAPNGNIIKPPAFGWRWSKDTLNEKMATGEIKFNKDFTNIKRRTYLQEQQGVPSSTLWIDLEETGHNRQAKYEQKKLFPNKTKAEWFSTPKPEKLLKKIIDIASEEGDIVLDAFLGSGTTAAVSLKMNRYFIGIEQMDYLETLTLPRLHQVIQGEQGGISNEVNWQGGGSFIYAELFELNQYYSNQIINVKDEAVLLQLISEMEAYAHFDYRVNLEKILKDDTFHKFNLEEKKRILLESLDANMMYLSYSEIDDKQYAISKDVKSFNRSFYSSLTKDGENE